MSFINKLKRLFANQRGYLNPLVIVLAVVVLGAAGFAGYKVMQKNKDGGSTATKETASTKLSSTPYENTDYDFTFTPPEGWTQSEVEGTVVFFSNPSKDSQNGNELAASLNVTVEETSLSLADYLVAAKQQLAAAFSGYKIVSENNITLSDGTKGVAIEGAFSQGSYDIRNRQVLVVENGAAFVLTASSLGNRWDFYAPLFEASQGTFKSL